MNQNPLSSLRDIHHPPPIAFWPPAPGWFILFFLCLVLFFIASILIYKRVKKYRVKKMARTRLQELQRVFDDNAAEAVIELSQLLRRISLIRHSRQHVAGLKGEAWLAFLDKTGNTDQFTQGPGRLLITAPYLRQIPREVINVFPLIALWIEINT